MKLFCLQISLFFCIALLGQSKQAIAIKIYLEDAETNKNVSDAKVTLEGFEIPAITGKYDKEGKFYYFTEIPAGYNTVMAYHKKYNEKGFQNVAGLPKEVKLKLYDPINVVYDFLYITDSTESKNSHSYFYKSSFVEDPFKICISSKDFINYNDFKINIEKILQNLNLQIELVNPYWEKDNIIKNRYHSTQKEGYPHLLGNDKLNLEYVFPLFSGISNVQNILVEKGYSNKVSDICFIFRKKDGSKFKRFNDSIIWKLINNNLKVSSILLNKNNVRIDCFSSSVKKYKIRDKLNNKFNQENKIDSSKVFFYDNNLMNSKKTFQDFEMPNITLPSPSFILIDNESKLPKNYYKTKTNLNKNNSPNFQKEIIGLGILDIYDYYLR